MCHGAGGTIVEEHSGEDVRCGGAAGDDGGLGAVGRGPWAVRPARAELADRTIGCAAYSRCLCGHCHLVIHDAEHRCLQDLRLDQRSFYYDYRLVGEGDLTFAHRVDVACELHRREVSSEFCIFFTGKELLEECRVHVAEVLHHLDDLVHAADYCPVVVFRSLSVEKVEDSVLILHSAVIEGFSHRVLVLVRAICVIVHYIYVLNPTNLIFFVQLFRKFANKLTDFSSGLPFLVVISSERSESRNLLWKD